ncbi:MAG: UvrD-helicase domain-containing protein [Anaerolineaceae bacterium]
MVQSLPMTLLANLNPRQYEAVTTKSEQTLVLAGPGSGKTRVLTQRIAYLVQEKGVAPYQILAVTFTNKAAREMRSRVENLLNQQLQDIWLGTFHSICARLLRRETNALPYRPNFVIFDEGDQETLIKRSMREMNIDEKTFRPAGVLASISNAKNDLKLPQDYPSQSYRDEVVKRVYERYQSLLVDNNALDFDDLLFVAVRLLRENPDICRRYASRFTHVLVDEFQDTNLAQYELLKFLSSHHKSIFVVGDEDQSIYRWRGADYRNVLRFEKDYPDCQKILLEQNYRSPQNVLDTARAVINRNPNRTPKHLFTDRGNGDTITLFEAVDDTSEAVYVVDTIQQLVMSKRANPADFAVMYRTNAQSRLLEEAFLREGMAYRLVGAQRFYGRREVKDCIAYLRLVNNPDDEVSLSRIVNVPTRGIGEKTVLSLLLAARSAHISPGQVLLDLGQNGDSSRFWSALSGRGAMLLADFGVLLGNWIEQKDKISLPALFDQILEDVVYQEYIQDNSDEGEDRWGNVQELRKLAFEYQDRGMTEFLENLALVSDQDTLPEAADAPTLLTLHAAKGLEFSQVFIIGLDEGILPHSRSKDDPEQMMEERRLFYVGITRAKDRLYLVRAERRSQYGSFEFSEPSQFLADIPANLLKVKSSSSSTRRKSSASYDVSEPAQTTTRWASTKPAMPKPEVSQRYRAAMRVKHPTWGEGMVLDSRIVDGEEMLDVFFNSVGFKRLMASLANLEILS